MTVGFAGKKWQGGKNEFNYSDATKQLSHCGVFFIIIFYSILLFPPVVHLEQILVSHAFVADQGQAGNTERLGQEPKDSGKSEKQ